MAAGGQIRGKKMSKKVELTGGNDCEPLAHIQAGSQEVPEQMDVIGETKYRINILDSKKAIVASLQE